MLTSLGVTSPSPLACVGKDSSDARDPEGESRRTLAAICWARSCAATAEMAFSVSESKSMSKSLVVVTDPDELARNIDGRFGESVALCLSDVRAGGSNLMADGLVVTALLLNLTRPFSFFAAAAAAANVDASPTAAGEAAGSLNGVGEFPLALEPQLGDTINEIRPTLLASSAAPRS